MRRQSLTLFGCLDPITQKFYWKKSDKGNGDYFLQFLNQMRQRTADKQIVIILDNASIHISKKVKQYLQKHQEVHLFYLPPYSPEFNPVERFWKWIKPKIYGFSAIGGISELVERFRKTVWHYNNRSLVNPIEFKLEAYQETL